MVPRNAKYVLKVVGFSHCEKSKGEPQKKKKIGFIYEENHKFSADNHKFSADRRLCLHTAYVIQSMCEMRMGKIVCSTSIATFNHINDQVNKILGWPTRHEPKQHPNEN